MRFHHYLRNTIISIIDWFYQPIEQRIPKETFRYAVCGGSNTVLDIFLYFLTYNFILQKKVLHLAILAISPHIAAFLLVFPITFTTGFWLSKYITFAHSELRGRVQLFRYGLIVLSCILMNYLFLKFFVELCGFYPTISKLLVTFIVVIFSYFSQRHFTFKTANKPITIEGLSAAVLYDIESPESDEHLYAEKEI